MSHEVQWIPPDATVARAAKLMAFHNLGVLPVCSADGKAIGVITDRDIALRVVGKGRHPAQTKVGDAMTTPVQFVAPDCPIERAGEFMASASVSRLLVLSESGHLEGVISLADLLAHAPGHCALNTARGIYARETSDRSAGAPHLAAQPAPEFFDGTREDAPTDDSSAENLARRDADNVSANRTNEFKEFPG
jgi:signal-transduction protein with cAMP-binding, CBS, and nucleotidyltransferase domain